MALENSGSEITGINESVDIGLESNMIKDSTKDGNGEISEDIFEKIDEKKETDGNFEESIKKGEISEEDFDAIDETEKKNVIAEKEIEEADLSFQMEQTYRKSMENEKPISKDVKDAVEKSGGKIEGFEERLKKPDSFKRKVEKIMTKPDVSEAEALEKINDSVRYTEVAENQKLVGCYEQTLESMEKKGYKVYQVSNTWETEEPYKGVNITMENEDGFKFEMQFHTPESLEAKEKMHPLYEEFRLETTSRDRQRELKKKMCEISDNLEKPNDIEKIMNRRKR